jgi:uncharacterized protein YggE
MDGPTTALLSVRGEARVTVPPDYGVLNGALRSTQDTKIVALDVAAAGLRQLTDELGSLGGVRQTAGSQRPPLAWAAYTASTELERESDKQTGRYGQTGRVVATVSVSVVVRAFDLLDRLSGVLATHEAFNVHHVAWGVDPDNASWPGVRAVAIQNAIKKGRDYAEALGGSLVRVEHIADAGLLGGGDSEPHRRGAFLSGAGMSDTPSLDPVPQELVAVVDARFVATVAAL